MTYNKQITNTTGYEVAGINRHTNLERVGKRCLFCFHQVNGLSSWMMWFVWVTCCRYWRTSCVTKSGVKTLDISVFRIVHVEYRSSWWENHFRDLLPPDVMRDLRVLRDSRDLRVWCLFSNMIRQDVFHLIHQYDPNVLYRFPWPQ